MESSVDSTIATSFHCFPRLPFELRRMVWGLAVFPRTITCAAGPRTPAPDDDSYYDEDPWEGAHWTMYGYGTMPPPPLLQACSESRSVAISDGLYRAQLWPACVRIPQSPRYSWVNYELDTIHLPSYLLHFLGLEDKAQLRRAIIDGGDHYKALGFFTHFHIEKDMIHMQSLRELRILTGTMSERGRTHCVASSQVWTSGSGESRAGQPLRSPSLIRPPENRPTRAT